MRRYLAILPALFLSACIFEIHEDGNYQDDYADLTLNFTFDGLDCEAAGVDRIRVDVQGLYMGDVFRDDLSCRSYRNGLLIENLYPDTYEVTIDGFDALGNQIYRMNQPQRLEVSSWRYEQYTLDVPSEAPVNAGTLTVYWTFDGDGACNTVQDIRAVLIDENGVLYDDARYPCDFGGIAYDDLPAGLWTIELTAIDAMGRTEFKSPEQNIVVFANAANDYTLDLLSMW